MEVTAPRFMIAGTQSASGKTTLACALIELFMRRGLKVSAAKCGPDYLDVGFHERVLGAPSRNLDLFLADAPAVRRSLAEGAQGADITIIEGVMGYYDGLADSSDASSYAVAASTQTPVVLIVDARGRSLSLGAEICGFRDFRPDSRLSAIILNHARHSSFSHLKELIERECHIPVLGFLPELQEASFDHRHLGLVSASEVLDLHERIGRVASVLEGTLDLDGLMGIANRVPALIYEPQEVRAVEGACPVIAVARDEAFSFTYAETLDLLRDLGARIEFFSPLHETSLPPHTSALLISGGYPELHADRLSENRAMREAIRKGIADGMPTIAECGGFMYLLEAIEDEAGVLYPMVGALPGHAYRAPRLTHFGYVKLTCKESGLLAQAGETLRAHEFHYWQATDQGSAFLAQKPKREEMWPTIHVSDTLYAGFPHLYLPGSPACARRFVEAADAYAKRVIA